MSITGIETARNDFIGAVSNLTTDQAQFKPSLREWSIAEVTEHLVWAEQIGIWGMTNAIEGLLAGKPIWSGVSSNDGLSIEEVVHKTWKVKEKAPEVAEPKWGGNLEFWIMNLKNNAFLLRYLASRSNNLDLSMAIYPHPLSGPLNVWQRLEFLRFHLRRHLDQVLRIKSNPEYPGSFQQ